jgi:hypothetical protein
MFSGFLQAAAYMNLPTLGLESLRMLLHDAVPLAPAVILQCEALRIWLIVPGP